MSSEEDPAVELDEPEEDPVDTVAEVDEPDVVTDTVVVPTVAVTPVVLPAVAMSARSRVVPPELPEDVLLVEGVVVVVDVDEEEDEVVVDGEVVDGVLVVVEGVVDVVEESPAFEVVADEPEPALVPPPEELPSVVVPASTPPDEDEPLPEDVLLRPLELLLLLLLPELLALALAEDATIGLSSVEASFDCRSKGQVTVAAT